MNKEENRVLMTVSNLKMTSGVSSFWNSLLREFNKFDDIAFEALEIGGHGKNIFGILGDQIRFYRSLNGIKLGFINPSLLNRSFFRDAFFIRQLLWKKTPFVVFFHGWELDFEAEVDSKYVDFFMKTYGQAELIFVLSNDFRDKIYEWGYRGRVVVETTNADIELIDNYSYENRVEVMKSTKPFKILFLARLIREKGAFELVKAVDILYQRGFEDIELTIAGDGEDFKELQKMVKEIPYIHLTGDVQGEEKINLFKESHLYALPSYYGEGLPTSILEAMLFGIPVVTSQAGGLKYFFEDEKMGYLVETKNPENIADGLEKLLVNHKKMEEISKYNFIYAQEHVTNVVMAKRLHSEIQKVLQR